MLDSWGLFRAKTSRHSCNFELLHALVSADGSSVTFARRLLLLIQRAWPEANMWSTRDTWSGVIRRYLWEKQISLIYSLILARHKLWLVLVNHIENKIVRFCHSSQMFRSFKSSLRLWHLLLCPPLLWVDTILTYELLSIKSLPDHIMLLLCTGLLMYQLEAQLLNILNNVYRLLEVAELKYIIWCWCNTKVLRALIV